MPKNPHSLSTHPITVEPSGGRVVVRVGAVVVADTRDALVLREASYPAAYYLPAAAVDAGVLRSSDTTTYCPYKGDATYRSLQIGVAAPLQDAAWVYEDPNDAVIPIRGHLAFYPDKVSITFED